MSRLLTEEERKSINDNMPPDAKYGDVFEKLCTAQNRKTTRELLKELRENGEELPVLTTDNEDIKGHKVDYKDIVLVIPIKVIEELER